MTNRTKTKSAFFSLIIFLFSFLILSCGTYKKEGIEIHRNPNTSIQTKMLIYDTRKDSSLIRLFVPIEFDIINHSDTKVKLSSGYLSLKGGNVQSGSIDLLIDDKLDLAFRNIKFDTNEKKRFKAYTSYKIMIPNIEKEQILEEAEFAQHMFDTKKEVYNIGMIKDVPSFLLEKVPDSLKGFIRVNFYDYSTKKPFAKNIPVAF